MPTVTLSTPDDLFTLMIAPALGPSGSYSLNNDYILDANIDMTGYAICETIGGSTPATGFNGNFDGQGYTITIQDISTVYNGLFYSETSTAKTIQNLNLIYNKPGGAVIPSNGAGSPFVTGACAGSLAGIIRNTTITNCNIILGDNYTIGDITTTIFTGGLIGLGIGNTVTNVNLTAGNTFKVYSNPFNPLSESGFLMGLGYSTISLCNVVVGNNSELVGGLCVGGLIGDFTISIDSVSLVVGDNCNMAVSIGGPYSSIGGLIGVTNLIGSSDPVSITNCYGKYGTNLTMTNIANPSFTGLVFGYLTHVSSSTVINNCIVLALSNTAMSTVSNVGAVIGRTDAPEIFNIYGLFQKYNITGSSVAPIINTNSNYGTNILSYSCGGPLPGSNLTSISTNLVTYTLILGLIEANPFLSVLKTYIEDNYFNCLPPPTPYIEPCQPIKKCRFCYSYKPPGPIDNCCVPKTCTNDDLAVISSLQCVTNNSTRTSERSLLLQIQQQYLQDSATAQRNSTLQNTLENNSLIASTIYGQLLQVRDERYLPYRPYIPPVMPQSVIDLQMSTVNVGVPMSFFTIADCKGSQSVTT